MSRPPLLENGGEWACHRFENGSHHAITRNQTFACRASSYFATCGTVLQTRYHLPQPATIRNTPQRHNNAPMPCDSKAVRGTTFSIATYAAITNTQARFMTPTTNRMPIKAKQHLTQYILFRNPSTSGPERFAYPVSSKPRGDRQRVRHVSLRGVSWKSPAAMRSPALSGVLALAIMGVTNAASR